MFTVYGDIVAGQQQTHKVFDLAAAKRWANDGYRVTDAQGYTVKPSY